MSEEMIWKLEDIYQKVVTEKHALIYVNPPIPALTKAWIRELIQWNQQGRKEEVPEHPYTEKFMEEVLREPYPDGWVPTEARSPKPEQRRPLLLEKKPCPICNGAEYYDRIYHGTTTGLAVTFKEKCLCAYLQYRWSIWGDPRIVPLRFRNVELARLKPSALSKMSTEDQEVVIKMLKDFPDYSYFIYGPAATGRRITRSRCWSMRLPNGPAVISASCRVTPRKGPSSGYPPRPGSMKPTLTGGSASTTTGRRCRA